MKTSEETKKEINTEDEGKESKKNEGEINDNDAKAVAGGRPIQLY